MSLINCVINLLLTLSANCVISSNAVANQAAKFTITDTKLYVSVVTQNNPKLLQQLKSVFKHLITWNKYQ